MIHNEDNILCSYWNILNFLLAQVNLPFFYIFITRKNTVYNMIWHQYRLLFVHMMVCLLHL